MKHNLKKLSALLLALLLALPAFTLAEDGGALSSPEIVVEALEAAETVDGTAPETAGADDGALDLEIGNDDALDLPDESIDLSLDLGDLDSLDADLVEGLPSDAEPAQANDAPNATEAARIRMDYVDAKGKSHGPVDCTVLDGVINNLATGWYTINKNVDYSNGLTLTGDVNLIIPDNQRLHVKNGIYVQEQAKLTLWSQSLGKKMGELNVQPGYCRAAIGGTADGVAGPIIINGGVINSTSDFGARTIGAANGKKGGFTRIEINGGIVHAAEGIGTAEDNKRIGDIVITGGKVDTSTWNIRDVNYAGMSANSITISGDAARGDSVNVRFSMLASTITINSGKVEASGNPGIGPFDKTCNITINGGTVIAQGAEDGAAIGSGAKHDMKGAITINGGTVEASCVYYGSAGAGIGSGWKGDMKGTVTINGGKVTAKGSYENEKMTCGAGIGAGSNGDFMGKVTITGGTVLAASTTTEREKYIPETRGGAGIGAGWAGNASKGTVTITGGKVTAIGTQGAAGIGGGMEGSKGGGGEGSNVRISGTAEVFAFSGGTDAHKHCSAIGHGENDRDMGTLVIGDNMLVQAGSTRNCNERIPAFSAAEREGACMYRWCAHIVPCVHPFSTYSGINEKTHTVNACLYCKQSSRQEPHSFDPSTQKCRSCGYAKKASGTVTFDANGGKGRMTAQSFFDNKAQKLNANAFTWKGHTFKGWNTKKDGSGTPYADKAKVNPNKNITLYAQWYVNVTLVANSMRGAWNGKPYTVTGYKTDLGDRYISVDFPGVSATRTETEVGKYPVKIKGATVNKTTDSAGKYLVTRIEDGELSIEKNFPDYTLPKPLVLTYNGKDQALIEPGTTNGGTMIYKLEGQEWSEKLPTGKDEGVYAVWYAVLGDKHYENSQIHIVVARIEK